MIRRATIADAAALATLCGQVQQLHVDHRRDVFVPAEHETLAAWFRAQLGQSTNRAWIAEQDGAAVAYAYVTFQERPPTPFTSPMHWVEIVQVGVDAAHRRQGCARALIQTVIADARRQGIHDIRLKTWAFNAEAQAAFHQLGFRPRTLEFGLEPNDSLLLDEPKAFPPDGR